MKNNNRIILLFLVCLGLFFIAFENNPLKHSQNNPKNPQDIIATINGESITVEAFKKEMARHGGHIPGRFDSMEQKKGLLEEILRFEVLALKAKKLGYEKDPEIISNIKKMMAQKFWQDRIESKLKDIKVTDEEIKTYYEAHLKDYTTPEMARAAVIYLKLHTTASEKFITDLEKKAEAILEEAKKAYPSEPTFGQLAKEYSDDNATKYRGGDIGWISKGAKIFKWDKQVIDAIFSLKKIGDIGPIIQTSKGLYLLKLIDKKEGTVSSLTQVKEGIEKKLISDKNRKAQKEYYQSLKKEFEIKINWDLLNSLEIKEKNSREGPPTFPLNSGNK